MKATLVFPIATLSGKIDQSSDFYFRCVNGRQYAQRCPMRAKPLSAAQIRANELFARRARMVAQMQLEGSLKSQKELWKLASQAL